MMKSALTLLALATSATAFAPQGASKSSTALNAEMDKYYGSFNFKMDEMKFDPVSNNKPQQSGVIFEVLRTLFLT